MLLILGTRASLFLWPAHGTRHGGTSHATRSPGHESSGPANRLAARQLHRLLARHSTHAQPSGGQLERAKGYCQRELARSCCRDRALAIGDQQRQGVGRGVHGREGELATWHVDHLPGEQGQQEEVRQHEAVMPLLPWRAELDRPLRLGWRDTPVRVRQRTQVPLVAQPRSEVLGHAVEWLDGRLELGCGRGRGRGRGEIDVGNRGRAIHPYA